MSTSPARGQVIPFNGPRNVADDPPCPPALEGQIRVWHDGYKFREGAEVHTIGWIGFECRDRDRGNQCFYPKDDVSTMSDDGALAEELWQKCKDYARGNNGVTAHIDIVCIFDDGQGRRFEDFFPAPLTLNPFSYGHSPSSGSLSMTSPTRNMRQVEEIILDAGRLFVSGVRENQNTVSAQLASYERTIEGYRKDAQEFWSRWREMVNDRRKWELDKFKSEMMMKGLQKLVEKAGIGLPWAMIQVGKFVKKKFDSQSGGGPRGERAYATLRKLFEAAKKKNGLSEQDPKQLIAMLKAMVGDDEELIDDVKSLLFDYGLDDAEVAEEEKVVTEIRKEAFRFRTDPNGRDGLWVKPPEDPIPPLDPVGPGGEPVVPRKAGG